MSKISCKVRDCSYNQDCCCHADNVEVVNCNCNSATTSNETACKTFIPYRSSSVKGVVGEVHFD